MARFENMWNRLSEQKTVSHRLVLWRLARFSSKIDVASGPKSKAAETIPFRLELPAGLIG